MHVIHLRSFTGVFNSGVMVLRPSQAVFSDMMKQIHTVVAYDGGDQGFLIKYFEGNWLRLVRDATVVFCFLRFPCLTSRGQPFIYNALQTVYLDGNNRKVITPHRMLLLTLLGLGSRRARH
jgi:hypothetical protein